MESLFTTIYWVSAGVVLAQALLLILQAWENRRYARSCLASAGEKQPSGRAEVFVPCKGMDVELQDNLQALLQQDYNDSQLTFIVESDNDPACQTIQQVIHDNPEVPTRLVVAGQSLHTGQKVHNLRKATESLADDVDILVFVDSDARPKTGWLRALVDSLASPKYAAVTGYRWFIPQQPSLANWLLYGINSRLASLLGRDNHYIVWGGSWAVRRDVFEEIGLHEAWKGTLSDDLVASRVLRLSGKKVRFEPSCMAASPADGSLWQMFEFMRRQYVVGKFYTTRWWAMALTMATVNILFWVASLAMICYGLAVGSAATWIPATLCTTLYMLGLTRGAIIQNAALKYFPDKKDELHSARLAAVWGGPVLTFVNWLGLVASMFDRHITWRGITYRIFRGGGIQIVGRHEQPPQHDEHDNDRSIIALPQETTTYRKAG